jgi:RecA-family ATPase
MSVADLQSPLTIPLKPANLVHFRRKCARFAGFDSRAAAGEYMPEFVTTPETATHVATDAGALETGGRMYTDKLKVETFNLRVRRDARRIVEQEERDAAAGAFTGEMKLIYDPLPTATPELIPGLLPESGTAGIVGETDTGKSLIACEIGSSLLTGELLWGAIQPNRTIKKVVYILGEHTCQTIQGLFHRTQLPHAGKFMLIGPEHLHPYKALVIGGVQQPIAVDRLMKWTEGAELIVFDPLGGFAQGLNTENDSASMRTLIDSMSLIATKHGSACLILSHMGKPKLDDTGNEIRRTSYAMRGSSAQEDALTHVFYLRKALQVKQQRGEGMERFDLSIRKFKGNPSDEVYRLQRDPHTKRNSLLNTKPAKGAYPDKDEIEMYRKGVQRLLEANPAYNWETAVGNVAAMHGLSGDTLKRYLSGS